MSYEPLARRYRPQTFRDLVGQEYTTLALSRALALGRAPQAIIFTGIRGVGKTTLARVYAKALNCEKTEAADFANAPCNICENCLNISRGAHEDVIEIDGASHTGVDDMRALIETMKYAPAHGRYKIYIIDEVHMLSKSAFNALLKSVEEPPTHVVFIFATTELEQVPDTIQSRCQVFHLRKISDQQLQEHLGQILKKEGISYEADALLSIARQGDGSLRDALSLLDQAIALGNGTVNIDSLNLIAPTKSRDFFMEMLRSLALKKSAEVLQAMRELSRSGYDYQNATDTLSELAHHSFLALKFGKDQYDLHSVGFSEASISIANSMRESINPLDLARLFKILRSCASRLQGSALDHLVMENYLLEWCFDPGLPLIADLLQNPELLRKGSTQARPTSLAEAAMAPPPKQVVSAPPPPNPVAAPVKTASEKPINKAPLEAQAPAALPASWEALLTIWKKEKPLQARKLEEVVPLSYSPELIRLACGPDSMSAKELANKQTEQNFQSYLEAKFFFKGKLQVEILKTDPAAAAQRQGASSEAHQPRSVLQEKTQQRDQLRQEKIQEMIAHPLTQVLTEKFQAKISRVDITDANLLDL